MRTRNIFYRLITNEDQCTELLCNMLQFPFIMVTFKSFLKISDLNIVREEIITRAGSEKLGIPDFQYFDKDISLLIEIKKRINTTLTKHQPKSYIKTLKQYDELHENKYLFFLVPLDYEHLPEIYLRLEKYQDKSIKTDVLFWEKFVRLLKKNQSRYPDNIIINDYIDILNELFPVKMINMENTNIVNLESKDLLKQWNEISEIVDIVYEEFKDQFVSKGFKAKMSMNHLEYGFYIEKKGKLLSWFGRWTLLWEKSGFALALYSHNTWLGKEKLSDSEYYLDDYGPYYPLKDIKDKSKIIDECIEIIEKYL